MYNYIFKRGATMRKKIIGISILTVGIAGVVYAAPASGFANQEQLEVARMRELSGRNVCTHPVLKIESKE